jgi:hypothetical protein
VMARSTADQLVQESERLRGEMLKMADQLKKFSEELLEEVHKLDLEAGPSAERGGGSDDRTGES